MLHIFGLSGRSSLTWRLVGYIGRELKCEEKSNEKMEVRGERGRK
jgi:hypothetical protein